jgi:hypothetical protein
MRVRFKPFGEVRWLPWLALVIGLPRIVLYGPALETTGYAKRMALAGALVAIVSYAALSMGGCGGGSAVVLTPPPIITPAGTSTIVITPTAMSSTGQPLQLQPNNSS